VLPSLRRGEDEREALLTSAARLYVEGHAFEWTALNGPGAFADVPGYPFQRERFWLPPAPPRSGTGLVVAAAGDAHPMLGAPVEVAHQPGTRIWPIVLDTRQWPFVAEHRLDGVAVLPASVSLELLLAAAASAIGDGPIVMRAFELCRPLFIRQGETPLLQVSLVPSAEGSWTVRLHEMSEQAASVLAQGQATALDEAPLAPGAPAATVSAESTPGETFYADLEQRGVGIGERLRSVSRLVTDGETASALLARPGGGASTCRLDPAVSDGLLQLTAAVTGDRSAVYMPTTVGEVRWHRRAEGTLTAIAQRTGRAPGEVRQRLLLLDAAGELVVELTDVRLRTLGADDRRRPSRPAEWLYSVTWRALALSGPSTVKLPSRKGRWIVLADETGVAAELARWLERKGQAVTLARAGDRFAQEGPDRFLVRPHVDADFAALFDAASGRGAEECQGIVCMWPLDAGAPADGDALDRAFDRCVAAGLHTVQSAARRAWEPARPRVWLVTRGAQIEAGAPWGATVWGLGRVVGEEQNDLYGGLVDLDPAADAASAAEQLGLTMWSSDGEPESAWRAGERLVPRLARVEEGPARPLRWHTDATYVVTGAFGGIGQVVARWMVEQGARHLLLVGRTQLPPRSTWRDVDVATPAGRRVAAVRELEAAGATVHLAIVDIADEAAVEARLAEHDREGWPPVRGVVHCAAVTEDRLVDRLDEASLAAVLRPKARGAWVLQRQLDAASLDFVVLFSSLGSVFGQPGQAAYAAANAFLDAAAVSARRHGTPVYSINWGGWRGLGFADTAGGQRTIAGLEEEGIHTFDAREGLEALTLILGGAQHGQVAVAPIDWQAFARHNSTGMAARLAESLTREATRASDPQGTPSRSLRDELAAFEGPARREHLETHLAEQLAQVLRVPASRLDPTTPLGSLGLQSLSALELRNQLERSLGVKLSATLVWNHPTIRALATFLLGRIEPAPAAPPAPAPAPAVDAAQAAASSGDAAIDVADMSEDEALNALLGGRG
jgi:NAD(P)-dependent dehydrogenase (short-subunit alcohol dehydrogenase family)/acyl carrier protein